MTIPPSHSSIYLLSIYPKSKKKSLSPTERNKLKQVAKALKADLEENDD